MSCAFGHVAFEQMFISALETWVNKLLHVCILLRLCNAAGCVVGCAAPKPLGVLVFCFQHSVIFFFSIFYSVFYTVSFTFIFCVWLYARPSFLRMCTVIMLFFVVVVVSHVYKRKESYVVDILMFLWPCELLLRPAEEHSVLKLFEVVSFNALSILLIVQNFKFPWSLFTNKKKRKC